MVNVQWLTPSSLKNDSSFFILHSSFLRLWRFVLLVDGVVGELAEVRQSGDLVAGELTRGAGTEIHALHVGGNGEVLGRVGRGGADTGREDAEVRDLHRLTLKHQLADTGDHVGENRACCAEPCARQGLPATRSCPSRLNVRTTCP